MCTPKRDTMHLRNKTVVGVVSCSVLATAFLLKGQAVQGPDNQHQPQATPLPKDIDPTDPALPVWMRPAHPVAKSTPAPSPTGKPSQPQPEPGTQGNQGQLGEVTKSGVGGFTIRVRS